MDPIKKNTLFYVIADNVSKIVAILNSIFLIKLVDIGLFGSISHIRSIPVFIAGLAWLGMDNVFLRTIQHRTKFLLVGYVAIIYFLLSLILSALVALIPYAFIGKYIFDQYNLSSGLVFFFSLLSLLQLFLNSLAIAYEKAKIGSFISIYVSASALISNIFLIVYVKLNVALIILIISYICLYLSLAIIYRNLLRESINKFLTDFRNIETRKISFSDLKEEFNFFKPYSISNILDTIAKRVASVYFANTGGTAILAVIALYNQFSDMIQSFALQINNAWGINRLKLLIQEFRNNNMLFAKRMREFLSELKIINLILILIFVASSPFWLPVFVYMIDKWHLQYSLVVSIITCIALRYCFDFLGNILQYNHLYSTAKIGTKIYIYAVINILVIPANIFLARELGIYGALIASLLPGISAFIIGEILLRRFRQERKSMLGLSIILFVPVAFSYFPGRITNTFFLGAIISSCLIIIGYHITGKEDKRRIKSIIVDGFLAPILPQKKHVLSSTKN